MFSLLRRLISWSDFLTASIISFPCNFSSYVFRDNCQKKKDKKRKKWIHELKIHSDLTQLKINLNRKRKEKKLKWNSNSKEKINDSLLSRVWVIFICWSFLSEISIDLSFSSNSRAFVLNPSICFSWISLSQISCFLIFS